MTGCAIIGFNGKITGQILSDLIFHAKSWGPHAAGLAHVEKGKVKIFKRAGHPVEFLKKFPGQVVATGESSIGMAHVRHATHGSNCDKNAHPFTHNKRIHFIHNGIIHNYAQLSVKAVVDSECLGPLIEQRDLTPARGSCAVAWFEGTELFVYRRNQYLQCARFFSPVNGEVLTLVATSNRIWEGLDPQLELIDNIPINEGIAYRVKQDGLERVWDDLKPDSVREKCSIHTGYTAD